jgi:glycosyltransferase involved in cell wall biosynthesis
MECLNGLNEKKVVHITTVHQVNDNRIFYKQCVSLVTEGYKVILIAPHNNNETLQGVEIKALKKTKSRLTRITLLTWSAYRKAVEEDAAIYHFHDPELIPVCLLLRAKGKIVIYDVHEDYITAIAQKDYLPRFVRQIIAKLFSVIEYICSRLFVVVLAEKYYSERFPGGITVLNYPRKILLNDRTEKRDQQLNLIYTGNVTVDRGADNHVKILNCMENVSLWLVGECKEHLAQRLYELAGAHRKRLHIVGIDKYVSFNEILGYYSKGGWLAGLAVFPLSVHYNRKELTKFFEYMAAGIPVICSDFPVWQKLMQETGAGIAVNPDDESGIAQALKYLIDNPYMVREMGLNGMQAVAGEYNWEHEELKLFDLYRKLLR